MSLFGKQQAEIF